MIRKIALTLALSLGMGVSAVAGTISISPNIGVVNGTGSVDVIVSNLADILTLYDLTLTYDPTLVQVSNVNFGGFLGGPADSLQESTPISGSLNLFELSFLDDPALTTLQPNSFRLATVTFQALSFGTSPLSITVNDLFGAGGLALPTQSVSDGQLEVSVGTGVVPEPGTWLLMVSGLGVAGVLRRRR